MLRSLFVIVALLLAPLASADASEGDLVQPIAAVLRASGDDAIVSWIPGQEVADQYHVYGVGAGERVLLDTVRSSTHAVVVLGFASYEVTGVLHGIESQPTVATGPPHPCIHIHEGPPPSVTIGCTLPFQTERDLPQSPLR